MAIQVQQFNFNLNVGQGSANALEEDQGLFIRVVEQSDGQLIIILKDKVIVVIPPKTPKEVEKGEKPSKKWRKKGLELIGWLNVGIFFLQYLPAVVDFLTRIRIEII